MTMNNDITVRYIGKNVFDIAMRLSFTSEYDKDGEIETMAAGYKIENNKMYLFNSDYDANEKGVTLFPYKLNFEQCIVFVWGWLQNVKPLANTPDTDGSVEQGFNITTEGCDWRGGSKFYSSFISIEPVWIIYGK